ncbi:MAG: AAA family ATPase [Caldilineales bacterium]|nr:AAA family ATPase [Caldilineales bacterium]
MSMLKILLLGAPQIEVDGKSVIADTRKAIALAAYLAATPGAHTREALSTLLYPDYDASRGRAALRRTLSALTKTIGSEHLHADRLSIYFTNEDTLFVDLRRFVALIEQQRAHKHGREESCPHCLEWLSEAAELYRDDFLAGFSLRDSPEFDEWQFFQSENLRHDLAYALDQLSGQLIGHEQYEAAIPHARRWLGLDMLHEPAHRQLMLLYAWTNQWSAAIRQYEECRRILAEELGVEPLPETTALYEEIRKARSTPSASSAKQASVAAMLAPPVIELWRHGAPGVRDIPLVGRQKELGILQQAYEEIGESGRLLAILGEAGIGKTRLMDEFLGYARGLGAVTMGATCYEGETNLAFGPLITALRTAMGDPANQEAIASLPTHVLNECARLLPELAEQTMNAESLPPLSSPGRQTRFFAALRQLALALLSGARPGVFFFDDLQWADDATLEFMAYLVRRLDNEPPICLLFNWRDDSLAVDHPLNAILKDARRAETILSLSLKRLPPEAVASLVTGYVKHETDPDWRARFYRETEGIPFFVVEYLKGLEQVDAKTTAWDIPASVRDLLHARLTAVNDAARQVLTAAAVIGRSYDFDAVRMVSGRSDEETLVALEELVARGIITESGDGPTPAYDFCHEKLRSLVYEEAGLARRRLLHLRVAQALSARYRPSSAPENPPGQIAFHFQRGGDMSSAAHYFVLAGDQARDLYANAEALSHYRAALALGYPQSFHLHETIADLLTLRGDYGEALRTYELASAAAKEADLARLEQKVGILYQRRGDYQLAETHLVAALALLGEQPNPSLQATLLAERSLTAHNVGQPEKARDLADLALELAKEGDDEQALARTHNILGILAFGRGDLANARQHLQQSLALAQASDEPAAQMAALNNLALVQAGDGDVRAALALAEQALALCTTLGDRHREAAVHNQMADLLHILGEEDAAMTHLKQAVKIFADIGEEEDRLQPEIWKLASW